MIIDILIYFVVFIFAATFIGIIFFFRGLMKAKAKFEIERNKEFEKRLKELNKTKN